MNYAIRPATPTPIICRKDNQDHLVVYLLDTLHPDTNSIEKWTVGDKLNTLRVNLSDYQVSKGLADTEEQVVADAFVDTWGARNGVVIRKRLWKQSPHHAATQKSADTSLVPPINGNAVQETPKVGEEIKASVESKPVDKDQAIQSFEAAIKSAQVMYTQTELDQTVATMKQELADKLIVAFTKALLDVLWKQA